MTARSKFAVAASALAALLILAPPPATAGEGHGKKCEKCKHCEKGEKAAKKQKGAKGGKHARVDKGEKGEKPGKIAICHMPPGNPGNAKTLYLPEAAVAAHLGHGDQRGACGSTPDHDSDRHGGGSMERSDDRGDRD